MHAANELVGDERYDAFQQIEHDLVRDAAPAASMRTYNNRYLFSRRMGCYHYTAAYRAWTSSHALRAPRDHRPTTRDRVRAGTLSSTSRCRLSSEMDNTVTVDYATADGTAHAGTTTSRPPER